jgi:hypothetical protein
MGNYTEDDKPRERKERQEYSENRYLSRIRRFPRLSEEESRGLLARWKKLGDLKAKNQVTEGNLHLVPPIAKATAKRFRFTGTSQATYYNQARDPLFPERFNELVSGGSLGLCQAADCFDPASGHLFTHYARRCIRNECLRAAKRLLSVVDRPYYQRTPMDILLDPSQPDPVPLEEYCGSRARPSTSTARQDAPISSVHAKMRWPKQWEVRFEREDSLGARVYDLRKAGLTLKETADKLGMSITTVWRRQQAFMEARYE